MILDAQLLFSDGQTFTADATSTNVVDLAVVERSLQAEDLYLFFYFTVTPTFATSLQIDLRSGATSTDLSSSPAIHWSSGAILAANYTNSGWVINTTAGVIPTYIKLPLPSKQPNLAGSGSATGMGPYKRFLGMFYDVTGAGTATITAGIIRSCDIQHYPVSGYSIAAVTA